VDDHFAPTWGGEAVDMFQEPEDADPFGDCIVREAHNVAGRPCVLMLVRRELLECLKVALA
jgi:hypothetical protein